MIYKIFIDDEREPPGDRKDWVVCRTVGEAIRFVELTGYPQFVSFDHDLGEGERTGMDFAKWLVDLDLTYDLMPSNFDFYVHSQNPVGRDNIEGLLRRYLQFKMA